MYTPLLSETYPPFLSISKDPCSLSLYNQLFDSEELGDAILDHEAVVSNVFLQARLLKTFITGEPMDVTPLIDCPEFIRTNIASLRGSDIKRLYDHRATLAQHFPGLLERFPASSTIDFSHLTPPDLNFLTQMLYKLVHDDLLITKTRVRSVGEKLLSKGASLLGLGSTLEGRLTSNPVDRRAVDMIKERRELTTLDPSDKRATHCALAKLARNGCFSIGQLLALGSESVLVVTNFAFVSKDVTAITLINPNTNEKYVLFKETDSRDPLTAHMPRNSPEPSVVDPATVLTDNMAHNEPTLFHPKHWSEHPKITFIGDQQAGLLASKYASAYLNSEGTNSDQVVTVALFDSPLTTPSLHPLAQVADQTPATWTGKPFPKTDSSKPGAPPVVTLEPENQPSRADEIKAIDSPATISSLPSDEVLYIHPKMVKHLGKERVHLLGTSKQVQQLTFTKISYIDPAQLKLAKPMQRVAYSVAIVSRFILGLIAFTPALLVAAITRMFSKNTQRKITFDALNAVTQLPKTLFWIAQGLPSPRRTADVE